MFLRSVSATTWLMLGVCLAGSLLHPRAGIALDAALCDLTTDGRVVVVGDVHGAYEPFVTLLRETGLIDDRERWIGDDAWLVQTGDVLDRGPDSRRAIDLLRKLQREAARAGGAVYPLLGNHEVMRLQGDYRYVSEGEYAAFRRRDSDALRNAALERTVRTAAASAAAAQEPFDEPAFRERFLAEIPLGFVEMRATYAPTGSYGEWLRGLPAVVVINDVAFLHGGISPAVAPLGCRAVNDAVEEELRGDRGSDEVALASDEIGPLWFRGLATEPEESFEPTLEHVLAEFGVRGFVIGHTPQPGRVVARFGGRVVLVDSGMLAGSFYPGGAAVALELDGATMTAIHPGGRREPLLAAPR